MKPASVAGLRAIPSVALVALSLASPATAAADDAGAGATGAARRIAVVIGRNDGGADRPLLRYAHSDARAFAGVLTDVGGVRAGDVHLVIEPDERALFAALDDVAREAAANAAGRRIELVVYYSGHSDIDGIILGDERVGYADVKAAIQRVRADVRVIVLDSCASGAFTRLKGGKMRPGFLTDEAVDVQGTAVLTSSSADEAAQESERLRGSFFTHALVTAMRGAGDASGDGRVSLTEAYQFAFADTLHRTERTSGGPQHAAFDIRLSGTGDLVMTDLRDVSSTLVLDPTIGGRVFLRDAARGHLVAELAKAPGTTMPLALAPGAYDVVVQAAGAGLRHARVSVAGGEERLSASMLRAVDAERTTARGADRFGASAGEPSPALFLGATAALAAGAVGAVTLGALALDLHVASTTPDGDPAKKQLALDAGPWLIGGAATSLAVAIGGGVLLTMTTTTNGTDE